MLVEDSLRASTDALPSLRLLHVIHTLNPAGGGPQENLLLLASAYREAGITLEALTLDVPGASFLARYPFPVHAIGPASSSFGFSLASKRWLRPHLRGFDAVIVDGLWFHLGLVAGREACKARIPYFVFPHGMLDPWFRQTYPLKHLKKQLFWWLWQYRAMRDAEAVLYTAEREQALARSTFTPPAPAGMLVPLGTRQPQGDARLQREAFFELCPAIRERRYLLFLSRIHPKKGCDLLVQAFLSLASRYPDVDLVMAGPDPDGLHAQLGPAIAASAAAGRVHWPGLLQGDAKWGAFRGAEAFVLPSHQENFGIAVAEAIACGLPVLISNKINIWDYVVEDGTGFVDEDTEEGARRLIEQWLEATPQARAAMAANTAGSFERRFSLETSALRIRSLITDSEVPQQAAGGALVSR